MIELEVIEQGHTRACTWAVRVPSQNQCTCSEEYREAMREVVKMGNRLAYLVRTGYSVVNADGWFCVVDFAGINLWGEGETAGDAIDEALSRETPCDSSQSGG